MKIGDRLVHQTAWKMRASLGLTYSLPPFAFALHLTYKLLFCFFLATDNIEFGKQINTENLFDANTIEQVLIHVVVTIFDRVNASEVN